MGHLYNISTLLSLHPHCRSQVHTSQGLCQPDVSVPIHTLILSIVKPSLSSSLWHHFVFPRLHTCCQCFLSSNTKRTCPPPSWDAPSAASPFQLWFHFLKNHSFRKNLLIPFMCQALFQALSIWQ